MPTVFFTDLRGIDKGSKTPQCKLQPDGAVNMLFLYPPKYARTFRISQRLVVKQRVVCILDGTEL